MTLADTRRDLRRAASLLSTQRSAHTRKEPDPDYNSTASVWLTPTILC